MERPLTQASSQRSPRPRSQTPGIAGAQVQFLSEIARVALRDALARRHADLRRVLTRYVVMCAREPENLDLIRYLDTHLPDVALYLRARFSSVRLDENLERFVLRPVLAASQRDVAEAVTGWLAVGQQGLSRRVAWRDPIDGRVDAAAAAQLVLDLSLAAEAWSQTVHAWSESSTIFLPSLHHDATEAEVAQHLGFTRIAPPGLAARNSDHYAQLVALTVRSHHQSLTLAAGLGYERAPFLALPDPATLGARPEAVARLSGVMSHNVMICSDLLRDRILEPRPTAPLTQLCQLIDDTEARFLLDGQHGGDVKEAARQFACQMVAAGARATDAALPVAVEERTRMHLELDKRRQILFAWTEQICRLLLVVGLGVVTGCGVKTDPVAAGLEPTLIPALLVKPELLDDPALPPEQETVSPATSPAEKDDEGDFTAAGSQARPGG